MYTMNTKELTQQREESTLAAIEAWQTTGDRAMRSRAIELNLNLVFTVCKKTARQMPRDQWDDLHQEGSIGLFDAVDKYDPVYNVKFGAFASSCIKSRVSTWCRVQTMPSGYRSSHMRLIVLNGGVTPEDHEQLRNMKLARYATSIDASIDDNLPLHSTLPDTHAVQSDVKLIEAQRASSLRTAVSNLDHRTANILNERWLIDEPKSLRKIGAKWGISGSRTHQIELTAFATLRAKLKDII